jgi:sn-glycerol 3-phosphate transport system permease protein
MIAVFRRHPVLEHIVEFVIVPTQKRNQPVIVEAARIDGAGPFKFFIDVLVPLSRTMMAAIFIIMFVYGWNQYLWPTLMTTDEGFFTLVRRIKQILLVWVGSNIPDYNEAFALAILAMLPPVMIVVIFQRWFIKGLTESDK